MRRINTRQASAAKGPPSSAQALVQEPGARQRAAAQPRHWRRGSALHGPKPVRRGAPAEEVLRTQWHPAPAPWETHPPVIGRHLLVEADNNTAPWPPGLRASPDQKAGRGRPERTGR